MTAPDQPTEAPSASGRIADELGTPITAERIAEITEHVMFKSDTLSWNVGLVLNGLLAHIDALAAERDDARDALQAAEARADGYALLVAELRAHLTPVIDLGGSGGGWQEVECCVCRARWYGGAADTPQIIHNSDCILAADPEARAAELLAGQREDD